MILAAAGLRRLGMLPELEEATEGIRRQAAPSTNF